VQMPLDVAQCSSRAVSDMAITGLWARIEGEPRCPAAKRSSLGTSATEAGVLTLQSRQPTVPLSTATVFQRLLVCVR
jgi:hypothetical protein